MGFVVIYYKWLYPSPHPPSPPLPPLLSAVRTSAGVRFSPAPDHGLMVDCCYRRRGRGHGCARRARRTPSPAREPPAKSGHAEGSYRRTCCSATPSRKEPRQAGRVRANRQKRRSHAPSRAGQPSRHAHGGRQCRDSARGSRKERLHAAQRPRGTSAAPGPSRTDKASLITGRLGRR